MSRLIGRLPVWLRRDQVAVRQELARMMPAGSVGVRVLRTVVLLSVLLIGMMYLTQPNPDAGDVPLTQRVWGVLFGVSVILQALCSMGATLTLRESTDTLDDALKTTPQGLELWLRARWLGGILRVRTALFFLLVARMLMIGALLVEVTAMRGTYLELLSQLRVQPPIPPLVLMLLVALGMVVALLLPIAHVALDSAVGLWSSRVLGERTLRLSFQALWLAIRLGLMSGSLWLMERVLAGELLLDTAATGSIFAFTAYLGDWGMTLLSLARSGDIWARVPYSVGVAVLALLLMLAQVAIADHIVLATVRRVERPD